MKKALAQLLRSWSAVALLACAWQICASAESIPVRHIEGTVHGFLELRSEDGHVLASGDSVQVAHGGQVTSRVTFHFQDGSIDDETTVFSQHGTFRLITDHHLQKGPYFPHPMDVLIDARTGQVTVHSTGKDGKEETINDHIKLPPDLANGLVSMAVANLRPGASETDVPMLVATPKPRLVKLAIFPRGEDPFLVAGAPGKAVHYEIKIVLGGVAGIVAPMIGKQPPDIEIWIVGGQAPTFLKENGPIYPEGPMLTIQQVSPTWPEQPRSGN
jgi:hypothetical protein